MISVILLLILLLVMGVLPHSLIVLALAGIISAIGYKWKMIFSHATLFYIGALILSVLAMVFYTSNLASYIVYGYLGYAFLLVVMMVGAMPNKWTFSRNIKKNRGVFSILGFIFITPHAFLHAFGFVGYINLFGIIAYVLMVPLIIISFQLIKREISLKDWHTIQKAAYVIYIVLFAHLLMVGHEFDRIIYAIIATIYINNKLVKEFRK